MKKQITVLVISLTVLATGCITPSHRLASRDLTLVTMGSMVDGNKNRMIKQSDDILALSKGLDSIMATVGFKLRDRHWSYYISPTTGTTYISDYDLKEKQYSGWVRCLTKIDAKNIEISFEIGESKHDKKDFPPQEEIRELTVKLTTPIRNYFSSRFPERAIKVSEIYWGK